MANLIQYLLLAALAVSFQVELVNQFLGVSLDQVLSHLVSKL